MGKATKAKVVPFDGLLPTDAQMASAEFRPQQIVEKGQVVAGVAYCRRPMIEILYTADVLSKAEYDALKHYRHHADIADRSMVRDSLAMERFGGSGVGPGVELVNAIQVRDDCERAAGSLIDILRAVVVYDMSLSQWAMQRSGAVEECETDKRGRRVCRMKPRRSALNIAKLEIQIAAKRVQAELDA